MNLLHCYLRATKSQAASSRISRKYPLKETLILEMASSPGYHHWLWLWLWLESQTQISLAGPGQAYQHGSVGSHS